VGEDEESESSVASSSSASGSSSVVGSSSSQSAQKVLAPDGEAVGAVLPADCGTKEECNRKFNAVLKSKDKAMQRKVLAAENERLTSLVNEFKQMEKSLKEKLKRGGANPVLKAQLKRIKKEGAKLELEAAKARKESNKVLGLDV